MYELINEYKFKFAFMNKKKPDILNKAFLSLKGPRFPYSQEVYQSPFGKVGLGSKPVVLDNADSKSANSSSC